MSYLSDYSYLKHKYQSLDENLDTSKLSKEMVEEMKEISKTTLFNDIKIKVDRILNRIATTETVKIKLTTKEQAEKKAAAIAKGLATRAANKAKKEAAKAAKLAKTEATEATEEIETEEIN